MASATQSPLHRSPLHHWHVAHGAHFVENDGWLLPRAYGNPSEEADKARGGAGLADISALSKWSLRGRGVPAVASMLGIAALRSVGSLAERSIAACRLMEESLVLLSTTTRLLEPAAISLTAPDILRTDITCAYAGFALVGNEAESLLGQLTAFDVSPRAFPQGSCAETNLAGVPALLVRPPTGFIDEISVYVAWDVGEYVWDRLCETGANTHLIPLGTEALAILRTVES